MAKDDYYVIVYKILAYLYMQLKKGERIDAKMLTYDGGLFQINRSYWVYIFENMQNQGFIRGLHDVRVGNGHYLAEQLDECEITPAGIDYLCNNNLAQKAMKYLKDIKDITPFI